MDAPPTAADWTLVIAMLGLLYLLPFVVVGAVLVLIGIVIERMKRKGPSA